MKKLLLLSILVGPLFIAVRTAKIKNSPKGFRKFLTQVMLFNLAYVLMLLLVWGRL